MFCALNNFFSELLKKLLHDNFFCKSLSVAFIVMQFYPGDIKIFISGMKQNSISECSEKKNTLALFFFFFYCWLPSDMATLETVFYSLAVYTWLRLVEALRKTGNHSFLSHFLTGPL